MPVVEANGVGLQYELHGDQGEPMVLIHGAWFDRHNWDPLVPELSRHFRVLTYDRRGHGQSERAATPGSMEEDAVDAYAILSELGLAPAHVVGQSTGAIVALRLVASRPQAVRSLAAHEPPLIGLLAGDPSFAPMLAEGRTRREAVLRALEADGPEAGARLFVETQMAGPGAWDRMSRQVQETFAANAHNYLDEMRNPSDGSIDLTALAGIRQPALLSRGAKSQRMMETVIGKLAGAIPGSKVFVYPDAGHNAHMTHPREFASTIVDFIRSTS